MLTEKFVGKTVPFTISSLFRLAQLILGIAALAVVAGCQSDSSEFQTTTPPVRHSLRPVIPEAAAAMTDMPTNNPATYVLREGDILKITFPGSPNLNSVQPIRTDGKISLQLVGEVQAAGLTPGNLQQKLMDLYAPQLSQKEVTVEVQSSSFPVYVTGTVLRPGKIVSDHPITALEAIMEAGGPDYTKANLKNVSVIRQEGNQTKIYKLNLKRVMDGQVSEPFYMKPSDIIFVPERFSWF
jgi:protein involved in polysaccharide export with SLBB domain